MYIDTHVHLNNDRLASHIDEVISDAFKQGVTKMVVVGYDVKTSQKAIELAHQYEFCYAIVGYHPTEIKEYKENEYKMLEEMAKDEKVIAIGEVGFDFHWDVTTKEEQLRAFIRQIEIAKKYHLPLSIHSRDAHQITFDTLKTHRANQVGGIMHSYSGSVEMAKEYVKMNFCFGISGPITFKNGKNMQEVVKELDIQYFVSETDAPYLTPEPFRGTENGPKYIPLIVKKMATLKGISEVEMANKIMENANRIFRREL